jgi:Uncharacterized protein conserved in bacteria (DUF2242)
MLTTLLQEGFIIEQSDPASGLIKAARDLADEKNKKLSYNVTTTVDISAAPSGQSAIVTMAANQQTVTHDSSHNWLPLLGPIMLPMPGKKYTTIVTGEGTITERSFYSDFFAPVDRNLRDTVATPTAVPAPSVEPTQLPTPANVTVAASVPAPSAAAAEDKSVGATAVMNVGPPARTREPPGSAGAAVSPVTPVVQSTEPPDNQQ